MPFLSGPNFVKIAKNQAISLLVCGLEFVKIETNRGMRSSLLSGFKHLNVVAKNTAIRSLFF